MDYGIVRGLAYYTGVVFEAFDRKREFRAIAGGGRYDRLFSHLSGGRTDLPALGFGMGDVVLLELLKSRELLPGPEPRADVFVMVLDGGQKDLSVRLVQELRQSGVRADYSLSVRKRDRQIRQALDTGARLALQVAPPDRVRIRDLQERHEEEMEWERALEALRGRFRS